MKEVRGQQKEGRKLLFLSRPSYFQPDRRQVCMNYRLLDPGQDWNFFTPEHAAPPDCLPRIRPLTEESASNLWREFISSTFAHPASLPAGAWPTHLLNSSAVLEWQSAWNGGPEAEFIGWLCSVLMWPGTTSTLFTWSNTESVETSWEVFCRCWRCFLFDDEGPILWSLQQSQAVRFMPSGFAYVGERRAIETF